VSRDISISLSDSLWRTADIGPPAVRAERARQRHRRLHTDVDSGTHMTKKDWLRTCMRIETRLDDLNIDAVMPETKSTSQKAASETQQIR